MTNRFLLKQFAENGDKGVFGSYQAGNKTVSSDPATLQSLTAWANGWADAISDGSHLPAMEEFQAVQYLICKAVKELYSEGIPVWMEGETYYKGAICSYIDSDGNVALYKNITGNNGTQQPALDIINWATFSAGGGEEDKANVDASNFTAIGRDNIRSLTLPDYNSAIDISASVPTNTSGSYIVPFNGIIILNHQISGGLKGYLINGIQVSMGTTFGTAWASFGNCQIPVKKGDVITVNESVPNKICYLIPFLGE